MPKKVKTIIEQRRAYIARRIKEARRPTEEARKLAEELFLSERQVYRDLKAARS